MGHDKAILDGTVIFTYDCVTEVVLVRKCTLQLVLFHGLLLGRRYRKVIFIPVISSDIIQTMCYCRTSYLKMSCDSDKVRAVFYFMSLSL